MVPLAFLLLIFAFHGMECMHVLDKAPIKCRGLLRRMMDRVGYMWKEANAAATQSYLPTIQLFLSHVAQAYAERNSCNYPGIDKDVAALLEEHFLVQEITADETSAITMLLPLGRAAFNTLLDTGIFNQFVAALGSVNLRELVPSHVQGLLAQLSVEIEQLQSKFQTASITKN